MSNYAMQRSLVSVRIVASIALAFMVTICIAAIPASNGYPFRQGNIQLEPLGEGELEYGCGCTFSVPVGEKGVGQFLLQWLYEAKAKLRINGSLHQLTLTHVEPDAEISPPTIGSRKHFRLMDDNLKVSVECTTYFVCPPESEECESTGFEGYMEVDTGGEKARFPVRGGCGC